MRRTSPFRKYFPKKIPPEIEEDIQIVVDTIVKEEPQVSQIRLFGSYNRGCFTYKSDIDIAVFLHEDDYFNGDSHELGLVHNHSHNARFSHLREALERIAKDVRSPEKFSINVFSQKSVPYVRYLIREQAYRGRLLYQGCR